MLSTMEGQSTPWGTVDHSITVIDGMWFVSTPGHGGIVLSPERQNQMPLYLRKHNFLGKNAPYYEEDCSFCLPLVFFEDEIKRDSPDHEIRKTVTEGKHRAHLALCYPKAGLKCTTDGCGVTFVPEDQFQEKCDDCLSIELQMEMEAYTR